MQNYLITIALAVLSFNLCATQITEFSLMLKPSTIPGAGIGVFATHDIGKDSEIVFFPADYEFRKLPKEAIPEEFLKLTAALGDGLYLCARRFDRMEICWYLNHSDTPNIDMIDLTRYRANRDIKSGEEIFMNYNQLNEPEAEKEEYYKARC